MLLLISSAIAAPVTDPVSRAEDGFVYVAAQTGRESVWERDTSCDAASADQSCDGLWRRWGYTAHARLTLLDGLAIDGEIGRQNDRLRQANYRGNGLVYAAGLRGALPLSSSGFWLAGVGRFEIGQGTNSTEDDISTYRLGNMSALLSWKDPMGNISTWGGVQGAWRWDHSVEPLGRNEDGSTVLNISMKTVLPVSGVIGGELISDPLGAPWTSSWRLSVGVEALVGQSNGIYGWAAVRY